MWVEFEAPRHSALLHNGTMVRFRTSSGPRWLAGPPLEGRITRVLPFRRYRYWVRVWKFGMPGWWWLSPRSITHVWIDRGA